MATVVPYPIATVEPRAAPNVGVSVPAAADIASFGGNVARDQVVAGTQLAQASENTADMALREAKEANDTRVQDLNNKYVTDQQKLLFTNPDAFYRKQGEEAINSAEPTTKALQTLKADYLAQASNPYQRDALSKRLDYHIDDVTNAMSRHVATQAMVWKDGVAKGTATNATNEAVLYYNDPAKVELHVQGAWQATYNNVLPKLGPVGAKAEADGVRSNAVKAVIIRQAADDPTMAKRTFDQAEKAGWLDATDAPKLADAIKDAATKRTTQNIVALVGATGGISPNYRKKVPGAEGGSPFIENKIGALGSYQMTPQTYTDAAQSTDWGKDKTTAEIRTMLLDPKDGPGRQEQLQGVLEQKQVKSLSDAGVKVNDLTLYATHFLGTGAGPALLRLPDDTPLQAGLLKAHTGLPGIGDPQKYVDKVNEANPFLNKINTVGDLKVFLAQKIGAPNSLANSGTPQKPNLEAMLANGDSMARAAGNGVADPDLLDKVNSAIKVRYATDHAIYTAQIGAVEQQAFAHIDAGGTMENLPTAVRAGLDGDSLKKVQDYEIKKVEKRRKDNQNAAYKDLTDLEQAHTLSPSDVEGRRNQFESGTEYRSWMKIANGEDRMDDSDTYNRLQRGLGTRDMRTDIFAEHDAGTISNATRNALLTKNDTFLKESAPATPYKINHDRIDRALSVGIADNPVARELFGKAMKEFDLYVKDNPQRDPETPQQYAKRLDDYSEDTVRRYTMIKMQDISATQPVPAHTPFKRGDMTTLPKPDATKRIADANADLAKQYGEGKITEEQYNQDAVVLMKWLKFLDDRPPPPPPAPAGRR